MRGLRWKNISVKRIMMLTGDDFMPAYCSYYTYSIYKFQVALEWVLLLPPPAV